MRAGCYVGANATVLPDVDVGEGLSWGPEPSSPEMWTRERS